MTATFSKAMLQTLAEFLDAEVELVSPEEARAIETRNGQVRPRQRVWRTAEDFLTPEEVLASHQTRSLALCNTVQRAQNLYRGLKELVEMRGLDIEILLLHSRFLPEDRRKTEETLRARFGKDAEKRGSLIAVATQTIEVGVDITCETLHTELAPASSLIQRAGRCARYPGEQGRVIVYPVESYMPYGQEKKNPEEEAHWVKEMKAAFAWLQAHTGEPFDFGKEQEFVDAVATARDQKVLDDLKFGRVSRAESIFRVLEGERKNEDQRLLVRDADSRLVLIHDDPTALCKNPYAATGFNLQIGTLYGMYKRWEERFQELDIDWAVKRLIEDKDSGADKKEENRTEYDWQPLNHASLLAGTRVLLVHPALAGYLPDEGFVADKGDTAFRSTIPEKAQAQTWEGYSYKLESYEEHIRLVLEAFRDLALPELEYPAKALNTAAQAAGLGWPENGVMNAAWLVCLLHDVGKLSTGWQNWVRAYQKEIGNPVNKEFAAAHTDSEWGNKLHFEANQAASRKFPKPHHAGESAWAVAPILVRALGQTELAWAALAAITRHHTPFARECQTYSLEAQATQHIQATLAYVPENIRMTIDLSLLKISESQAPKLPRRLIKPDQEMGWLAYTLLVRALRRADREGTQRGSA
jgi:CRISPR-associated endonuclease/helicase Cas3